MGYVRVGKNLFLCGGCNYALKKCYSDCFKIDLSALVISKLT